LGISTKERFAALPDLPPIDDTVKGFDAASWQMIVAPAKTPTPIAEKLHADLKNFLETPETRDQITRNGMLPIGSPSISELRAFVTSEIGRWRKVVEQAGLAGSQ
ncbi:MAG: Bug family tripartite tricarboxylate transporter substrate binding protein, partial [Xanthobacteraceae bacterium]